MSDMDKYLKLFFEETYDNLEILNDSILALENNPNDKEFVDEIFRVAHTLKGMAATMGFTTMAELTHHMENVFDSFKKGELKVTSDIITLLFQCLDILSDIVEDIKVEGEEQEYENLNSIYQHLDDLSKGKQISKTDSEEKLVEVADSPVESFSENNDLGMKFDSTDESLIDKAISGGLKVFTIKVVIQSSCQLKSARAYVAIKRLEDVGDVMKLNPPAEVIEKGELDNQFECLFFTPHEKIEIEETIDSIPELESFEVTELNYFGSVVEESENKDENNVESDNGADSSAPKVMKDRRKGERRSSGAEQSVRINMNRLDNIMNLVSELVIYRTRLEELSAQYKATEITEPLEQVAKITSDLQELVLNIRMQPVSNVFNRYPRMVRDLSQELGKSINLIIEGEETELDRTLVTEINDPIVHILRNAIDHGIETVEDRLMVGKDKTGTIYLSAYQEGNKVIIKVEDDGKGINPAVIRKSAMEKGINVEGMTDEQVIQLIFGQGFSTKKEVTNVSGRGVGMEVVKSKISSIGGDVFVNSTVGRGTSIVIELPLTLSIIQALLVKVGDESFAIPLSVIEKVAEIYDGDIKCSHNEKVYIYKGKAIPVIHVTDILEIEDTSTETNMIIVKLGQQYYGLVVGSMLGQQEVVIKAIGETLPNIPVYVGATILGDGKITLILDVGNICNSEKEKGARNAI